MKVVKFDACTDQDEVIIYPIGDVHIGEAGFSQVEFQKVIDTIKNTPNAYAILNGDIINNATRSGISDIYGEQMSPMLQISLALEMLEPIKDKIISATTGNHELRSYKGDGLDITQFLCANLGIQDRYSPDGVFVFLTTGKTEGKNSQKKNRQVYGIYHTHGSGGGKRAGSSANAMEDMTNIVDADILIRGHSHKPMAFPVGYYRANYSNRKVREVTKYLVTTTAFLHYGGYGEQKGYRPSAIAIPEIHLKAHLNKKVRVII